MHIAFFTNTYLPVVNGVVRSVKTFRTSLTELGHIVFVFAQEVDYQDEEPFIFRYPSVSLPGSADITTAIPISPFIDRLIPPLKLDVIHSHHPVLLGQAAAAKAKELALPLVFTFHTQYREYSHYVPFSQEVVQDFLKGTIDTWLKDYIRKCQHMIIPSESMREILVNEYGLKSRFTVIPTGIDLEPFQSADGKNIRAKHGWGRDKVMISVGRLAEEKNWGLLLQAAAMTLPDHPELRVVLLGDGPKRKRLVKFAADAGIADRVEFIGEVPFNQVPSYLNAADFFGFASTSETQGLVTLEALAAGLPVVAVDASGTRDIVQNGEQGWLVKDDANALSNAFHQLLNNQNNCFQKFHEAAKERAKEFDRRRLATKLISVYEQAIQDKNDNRFVEIR